MLFLFAYSLITLLTVSYYDQSYSTLAVSIFIWLAGITYCYFGTGEAKEKRKIFYLTFIIYLVSACIFSSNFSNHDFFMVSDSMRYIDNYGPTYSLKGVRSMLQDCYLGMADNNGLFNTALLTYCYIGNKYLDGVTPLYMTLFLTTFGILTIITLFRILLLFFDSRKATKYTMIFAIFSLFHFYSCVIIRDIVIVFLFSLSFEIICKKFTIKNLIFLFFYMLCAWGIRLFSGFFFISLIAVYVLIYSYNLKYKYLTIFMLSILGIYLVFSIGLFDEIVDKTVSEATLYNEESDSGEYSTTGLSSKLRALPIGLKQIALFLHSQANPFPPYAPLIPARNPSETYMAIIFMFSAIWWYFISFSLMVFLTFYKGLKYYDFYLKLLLGVSFCLILGSTVQMDVRRIILVYPVFYVLYLLMKEYYIERNLLIRIQTYLGGIYIFLLLVYQVIKFNIIS